MNEQPEQQPSPKARPRGEAFWKQSKEGIAQRNDQARKAGMEQRKAEDRRKQELRRAAEVREGVALQKEFGDR